LIGQQAIEKMLLSKLKCTYEDLEKKESEPTVKIIT